MEYSRRFKFLVCARNFEGDSDLEGARLSQIIQEIEQDGYQVLRARRDDDAELVVRTDAAIGCLIVDWGRKGLQGKAAQLISLTRKRGLDVPVIVLVRGRHRLEDIPVEVLDDVDGFMFLAEETPDFIAKNLVSRLRQYAESLKTPFFGALVDYAEQGNMLWTCPGHNGGVFYRRSPIGRIFVEHLGEAVFRDDLDNSVLQLGDLLTHEGPAERAEREAATIFGAERTYFVLNGTSTSNKVVLSALLAEGELGAEVDVTAFLASRYLLRDWVQARFGARLAGINEGVAKEGGLYLFTLRLIPVLPFFAINLLMGLTPIRTATSYLVSQLGMFAGTVVYVNAGTELARITSLKGIVSPGLLGAFVLLGVFGVAVLVSAEAPVPEPVLPESFEWSSPPGNSGLKAAWVIGAEQKSGLYALRVRLAPGTRIAPHAHLVEHPGLGRVEVEAEFDFANPVRRRGVVRAVDRRGRAFTHLGSPGRCG
jgi:hypothetical protein